MSGTVRTNWTIYQNNPKQNRAHICGTTRTCGTGGMCGTTRTCGTLRTLGAQSIQIVILLIILSTLSILEKDDIQRTIMKYDTKKICGTSRTYGTMRTSGTE